MPSSRWSFLFLRTSHTQEPSRLEDQDKGISKHLPKTPETYSDYAISLHHQATGELYLKSHFFKISCDHPLKYRAGETRYFVRNVKASEYDFHPTKIQISPFDAQKWIEEMTPAHEDTRDLDLERDGDYPRPFVVQYE